MTSPPPRPPVVTLAALYGAAGSLIGPRVAERLGVPLLDRVIPQAAARRGGLPETAMAEVDQEPRSTLQRLTASIGRASTLTGGVGGSLERLDVEERALRSYMEEFLARASIDGGVAVGRGGMVVLRTVPCALHVLLGGPPQARVAQRMALDGIDRATAEARRKVEDESRISYVRRAYGVDGEDARHYHLVIDSTALDIDICVDLIVTAARARTRDPRPSPPI